MDDDPRWMRDLARAARERRDSDARWDTESEEESAEDAAEEGAERSRAAADERRELTRPPSEARREAMVQAALKGLSPASTNNVVALRSKRSADARTWIAAVALLVAAAASFLLYFSGGDDPSFPAYALEVSAGVASARGEPASGPVRRVTRGGLIELVLRPERETETTPGLAVFAVQGARVVRIDPAVERDPRGALRLRVVLGVDVDLAPGPWTWVVALGAKDDLPDATRARGLASTPGALGDDLQVLVTQFEIERDAPTP